MCDLFADVLRSFVRPSEIDSLERFDDLKDVAIEQQLSNEHLVIGHVAQKALRNDSKVFTQKFVPSTSAFYARCITIFR